MDINKIFNLFNKDPDLSDMSLKDKSIITDRIVDYKNHPLFWVGIFKKLNYNHDSFSKKITNDFKDINNNELKKGSDFILYTEAFKWLSKINLDNLKHQEALLFYNDLTLISYVIDSIEYFQEYEEYEKCAILKNIQNFLEKSLT